MKTTYAQERLRPEWQRKRLEILHRDNFSCIDCESSTETLAVHHSYYVTGRKPWQYPDWSLQTLCNNCHNGRHGELDPDEEFAFQEWEYEMDWILKGDPQNISKFWDFFAEIAQTLDLADPDRMRAAQKVAYAIAMLGSSYRETVSK